MTEHNLKTDNGAADRQKGSFTIIAALGILGMSAFTAIAIDAGYMMSTRAELQNIADVAVSSGNLELARIYDELDPSVDPMTYELTAGDKDRIVKHLNVFAQRNTAAQKSITVLPTDVGFGSWNSDLGAFEESSIGVMAINVKARRDESANGVVSTLMANIVGRESFSANADAGAALAPIRVLPAGKIDFPVGISRHWFESKDSPCGTDHFITFYPTGNLDGCAGWHTFEDWSANAHKLKDILHEMRHGTFVSPEIIVGETELVFIGGTVDSALKRAQELFEAKKDADGKMIAHLPVYDYDDCANPTGHIRIVGIATVYITGVDAQGNDKRIDAHVACDMLAYGEGGGPDYGTHVGLPKLIR